MPDRTTTARTPAVAAAVAACVAPLWAAAPGRRQDAQAKLLAYRAARADAIRKLAQRIRALPVSPRTTIGDVLADRDEIRTSLIAWLSGQKEVGQPKYTEDGTCKVKMQVAPDEVLAALTRWHKRYSEGKKAEVPELEKIAVSTKEKVLTEIGTAGPREAAVLADGGAAVPVQRRDLMSVTNLRGGAKAYWSAHVKPQGRLMAVRAARVDAMRRLARRVKGMYVASRTTVRDFVARSDEADVRMQEFLRAAREKRIRYHDDQPIVEVDVEVTRRSVYANLKTWAEVHFRGDQAWVERLERLAVKAGDEVLRDIGVGVPPARYLRNVDAGTLAVMKAAAAAPAWVSRSLKAVGTGTAEPGAVGKDRAGPAARRAAEVDARRKLAERIMGLAITSETSVRDLVAAGERIETSLLAFRQGARVVDGSRKATDDGAAEVTVEIQLKPLWNLILHYQREQSIEIK